MKKSILFGVVIACSMLMTACGADETTDANAEKNTTVEKNSAATMTSIVSVVNEVDAWTGFEVEYSGIAPNGTISFENTIKNAVNNDIMYTANKTEGLSNGDVITITAEWKPNAIVDTNTFVITEPTKTFTVSGLKSYLKTIDGYDMSAIDTLLYDEIVEFYDVYYKYYENKDMAHLAKYFFETDSLDWWYIIEKNFAASKSILLYNEKNDESVYAILWELNVTIEKNAVDEFTEYHDEYNVGDTLQTKFYAITYIENVLINEDKSFDTEKSKIEYKAFISGGVYKSKTIEEYIENFKEDFEGYTVIE